MSNDQNPAVSVIVPARNEEACLALCLESLVSQTGMDFEIIVVDDASTDRTAEIAQSFAVRAAAELQDAEASTTGKGTSFTRADLGLGKPAASAAEICLEAWTTHFASRNLLCNLSHLE
jgi:hypothetical protein